MKHRGRMSGTLSSVLVFLLSACQVYHAAAQQPAPIVRGVVQNTNNEPLPGVSVVIRNTKTNFSTGTATDSSGIFHFAGIQAGGPYSFSFSMVGFENQTLSGYNLKTGATLSLGIKLVQLGTSLDQVVVVGYGALKRKDLTGSVGSLPAREIKDLAVPRVEQALSGRVAGVQVKFADGTPGGAPQIRVRGIGSISAGVDPLYVVDGFPTDNIQTINPNDIESLDILKDASATAIYGSRGSNGVIIINTKRGTTGTTKINFDTYYGVQQVTRQPEFFNARQQADYYYNSIRNRNMDLGNSVSGDPATWAIRVPQTVLDVISGKNTNDVSALDAVLRTAPQQSYNLSFSGGTPAVRYAVSGEYLNQDGIILNSNFKRYSIRANLDAQITSKLSVRLNLNPSFTKNKNVIASGGGAGASNSIIGSATSAQPYYPLYNPDGSYFIYQSIDASTDLYNPLALALEKKDISTRARILTNASLEYKFTNALRFNVLFGATLNNAKSSSFMPQLPVFLNAAATGTDAAFSGYDWLAEYTLHYNKTFGKHGIAALAGYTAQEDVNEQNSISSNNYPNNLIPYLSAVSGIITTGTATKDEWSIVSQLARINYNYDGKYLVTASIRRDGSSRFGSNNKYGVFPSAALAWRVSDESFLQGVRMVSELKLRASYGKTGNNNIGNYAPISTVNYVKYTTGGAAIGGFVPAVIPNPDLTWETQQQFNGGIDLGLFGGRLAITVDHFVSRNKDLLLNVNIPTSTGFSTALKNIGEVKNNGWEFVVSSTNISTKNFRWTTDFNISTYKNKVVRLGPSGDDIIVGNNITRVGEPIGMFYGYITDGIFKNAAELAAGPIYNKGLSDETKAGDIRFKDVSGPNGKPDGIITNADLAIMGSPYPDFYYGMTNRVSYKSISLSFNIAGSHGAQIYNNGMMIYRLIRSRSRTLTTELNYWKSEADPGDGKTVRPDDVPRGGLRLPSTRYIDNGSYLRVNNITLGYAMPEPITRLFKLNGLRIYVSANNAFILTKNLSFNPDVSNSGNALTPGIDNNNYPLPRNVVVGLNLSL
ncbi:MAG: TonB-dependent receptor [Williamsia sp.]|nr:TonB-dependent receptor [Williamsia sp.]